MEIQQLCRKVSKNIPTLKLLESSFCQRGFRIVILHFHMTSKMAESLTIEKPQALPDAKNAIVLIGMWNKKKNKGLFFEMFLFQIKLRMPEDQDSTLSFSEKVCSKQ